MVNAINQRLGELGTRGVDYELGGNRHPKPKAFTLKLQL
jgi:hypothetical protein